MREAYIMEAIVDSINQKIFDEWKHEGGIYGFSSNHINFYIDYKEYVLLIREIGKGENFSQMRITKDGAEE